eukprot:CAMPEP_0172326538 /NCGR_PEP_ID=MMETSP1058-20130122/56850_1 /TAXON_ID=83371 /ORGANISM="Detonula confervacea, Strain CCMP 353" /LENGTH=1134 /DNA_ID=CAMNT_0013043351 /DNA_START=117 /DNA_END=3521 /DNA_ORIENTATION=+
MQSGRCQNHPPTHTSHYLSSRVMGLSALAVLSTIIICIDCSAQLIDGEDSANGHPKSIDEQSAPNLKDDGNAIPNVEANNDDGTSSNSHDKSKPQRITLLGLEDILDLKRSDLLGLGNVFNYDGDGDVPPRLNYNQLHANDMIEDSFYDPLSPDPSCVEANNQEGGSGSDDCWHPPDSTVEEEIVQVSDCDDGTKSAGLETLAWGYGGADPDDGIQEEQEQEQQKECVEGTTESETEGGDEDEKPQCQTSSSDSSKKTDAATPDQCEASASKSKFVDKHWGSDVNILKMRDRLRGRRSKYWDMIEQEQELIVGNGTERNTTEAPSQDNQTTLDSSQTEKMKQSQTTSSKNTQQKNTSPPRPPVFLLPGLASTRLVSWKHKPCPQSSLLSDIKMLDYVWLNMNFLIQMATIDAKCWTECMTLGKYQTDYDGADDEMENTSKGDEKAEQPFHGCKLRPDEGLDAISSLAPGSLSSNLFVGGTNTVYSWLIHWLADNLGYDVTSIVALPYDWRLSPDKMEARDGFLTMTRKKIEAAVESNGRPGIMVAHSMGNSVFRYFLEWLRVQMQEEAYERYVAKHIGATQAAAGQGSFWTRRALYRGLINPGGVGGTLEGDNEENNIPDDATLDETSKHKIQEEEYEYENENDEQSTRKYPKLYELAKVEGDTEWIDWLGKHIWTYVGLAAPLLGAPGPLRSVLSGENMGLPFTDEEARGLELSFGSTSNVNPISTKMGFCDGDGMDTGKVGIGRANGRKQNLACLEELVSEIESSEGNTDPWKDFPALRLLLKDRVDFDSIFPTIQVEREYCQENEISPCNNQTILDFGPKDVMNGRIFKQFSRIWKEENDPLGVKLDQLRQSWWNGKVPNMLDTTPDRPHIKHVIMAYGTDVPTEVGYKYRKTDLDLGGNSTNTSATFKGGTDEFDGLPSMSEVIWEERHGRLVSESQIVEPASFTETLLRKKKDKRHPLKRDNGEAPVWLHHSGDGTIPYISLMWAHTWLLHATRAMRSLNSTASMLEGERISDPTNALEAIKVSHRPRNKSEWVEGYGADPRSEGDNESPSNIDDASDTGTSHPHGTKYKPKMVRFESSGKSRSTGMKYTTTVIEAIGVEHKETTRNYDILAAAFTDVLKNLHDDYGLI